MIKKILLIMPNFNWKVEFDVQKDPPMGVLYIAAVLEKEGFNVRIVDANAEGLTIDDVVNVVKEYEPQIIGISCNYAPLNNLSITLSERIKEVRKDIPIVIGGNHATASYKHILSKGKDVIDYIIRGQGETIFLNLVNTLNNKISIEKVNGIAYIKDNNIFSTQNEDSIKDLDELPMPAYHLLNMKIYNRYNIISSRGCPYNCNYCASNVVTGRKVTYRSTRNIVNEIKHLITNYGQKHFWFSDDTFTANYKHTNELLDLIIKENIKFDWSCLTRVNKTKLEILEKMKMAGCKYISYGVESGDIKMLQNMNKNIKLQDVKEALELTKQVGIDMYTFFLIGYPGETKDSIKSTFDLIREIKPTGASFAIVIPLPGTTLWEYLESENIIDYDSIEWDYLFAKSGKGKYVNYSAQLASKWCNIPANDLIELCKQGESLI